ncbi:cell division protein FtsL [Pseudomonas sp. F1_0610]|uniref:cell division protein FtsL n=1 Tax=Pseudomonas sp. F1_0610 TaxID=3114284 RepID=UPI0039C20CC1
MSRLYAKPMPKGSWLLWLLWIAILASAIWVSQNAYHTRLLLNELYGEYKVRDNAQAEWGRLMLEQSTWTAHNRIEKLAVQHLGMHMPEAKEVRMVKP